MQKSYRVVVMDSRGHGRSTRNEQPYGYDLPQPQNLHVDAAVENVFVHPSSLCIGIKANKTGPA